ncbi:unnamed protein product [Prorocentrum cordatum]|uniref:Methyltransferase FkbM domain-containing protein n=1 Tax=Prorocentrum cordatum TaxID=2364126 RepID=A0ABN9X6P9_9DINO|nr:unnamed protein product [Polarella glacialis]|mmetsp:Transcript_39058/g.101781  ORF Transcript_39058/g.101781 Transcript_39058/m.101781 type:complete len:393 (-) Transcript_39058:62-1240(-)
MVRRTLTLLSVVSYTVALQHASALLIHGRAVDGSKQPDETTKYCDSGEIYERSYLMPKRFPFPPIRLVMETASKTCDFYKDRDFCRAFSEDRNFEPEQHVKSALASFLDGCHSRECAAIDLGGNNGWMSAYMYSLGANPVYTVEPAADLAQALRDTITLNCWKGRGEVITGFAIAGSESLNGALPAWLPKNMPADNGWRAGGRPENLSLPLAPVIPLDDILLKRPRWDLIKMDADGPEGRWITRIEQLLSAGKLDVRTLVVEGHECSPELMHRLQNHHGYDIYLLDMHIDKRFLNAQGIDVYSHFQDTHLPEFLTEMYGIRFMRHVYHFRSDMTKAQWGQAVPITRTYDNQYVITKEELLEPQWEHPYATANPSPEREKSRYAPPVDGIGRD